MKTVEVKKGILERNQENADLLRSIFYQNRIFVMNLVSSPGSGKTSLLEKVLPIVKENYNILVIEGDLQTENDAERVRKTGVEAIQINTGGACHLEAVNILKVLKGYDLTKIDCIIIENVGNLVCPSSFDLGEDLKVLLISTTEGEDKPIKYPSMVRVSSVLVVNKLDLIPYVNFDVEKAITYAIGVNNKLEIFKTSCFTGEGI
ncbi:MAG: hydrogenase nickel incorporation protein HypB, partial [Calditerrivibrio sp.]|nr:hydrogenase nickel incorporation protein HypB [Calditerrivibrio sp.]